jgi:hypothetical protein
MACLQRKDEGGWTLPMYVMLHGSENVQQSMLAFLEELPVNDRVDILKYESSDGLNFARIAIVGNGQNVWEKTLTVLGNSPAEDCRALLQRKNNDGWNPVIHMAVHASGDVWETMKELIGKSFPPCELGAFVGQLEGNECLDSSAKSRLHALSQNQVSSGEKK